MKLFKLVVINFYLTMNDRKKEKFTVITEDEEAEELRDEPLDL
jgi:ribosomal protein L15E